MPFVFDKLLFYQEADALANPSCSLTQDFPRGNFSWLIGSTLEEIAGMRNGLISGPDKREV